MRGWPSTLYYPVSFISEAPYSQTISAHDFTVGYRGYMHSKENEAHQILIFLLFPQVLQNVLLPPQASSVKLPMRAPLWGLRHQYHPHCINVHGVIMNFKSIAPYICHLNLKDILIFWYWILRPSYPSPLLLIFFESLMYLGHFIGYSGSFFPAFPSSN